MAWYKTGGGGTDTSDATLNNGNQMLSGVTAYANDIKYTGSIETQAATTITPKVTSQTAGVTSKYMGGDVTVGAIYEEVSSSATMDTYFADNTNIGKMYKYTGTTDTSYTNGRLYVCETIVPKIISGGTATGVTISQYSYDEITTIQTELIASGYTASEVADASIFNITGTTVGTVILDVSELGDEGDPLKLIHKLSDGTYETLYWNTIPASGQITVTLTSFSPMVAMDIEVPVTTWNKYNVNYYAHVTDAGRPYYNDAIGNVCMVANASGGTIPNSITEDNYAAIGIWDGSKVTTEGEDWSKYGVIDGATTVYAWANGNYLAIYNVVLQCGSTISITTQENITTSTVLLLNNYSSGITPTQYADTTGQGTYIEQVTSTNPSAYPDNGIQDGYWYVKQS